MGMLSVLAWSALAVAVALLAWQSVTHHRLHHATGLHTFAYSQWLFGVGAVTAVVGLGFGMLMSSLVGQGWQSGAVTTMIQIYFSATVCGLLALVCLWTASQWHRLFREYNDWRAVVTGFDLSPGAELARWWHVHATGRVPEDAEVTHAPSSAPCWISGLAAILLLFGPLVVTLTLGGFSMGLTGAEGVDLLIFTPLIWALVAAFTACGAVMLASSLSCLRAHKATTE